MSRMYIQTLNSQTKTLSPDNELLKPKTAIRILGVDPGSRITGYGLIDFKGEAVTYVASGCIKLPIISLPERLQLIHADLKIIIDRYNPQVLAIEQVFVHRNPSSALKLGQARGAAICAAADLPVSEYTPAEVKQVIVGNGRAAKAQVQHMVQTLLKLDGELAEDAADALGIALTHARFAARPDILVKWGKSKKRRGRRAASAAEYKEYLKK